MKRFLFYTALVLVSFSLQNNVFAASSLISTVPNIMLIVVFSFGFLRGSSHGMLLGFACGLLSDVFFGSTLGVSALLYTIMGFLIGLLGRLYFTEFSDMPLLLCLVSDTLYHIGVFIVVFAMGGQYHFFSYVWDILIPELCYTGAAALVLYPLLRKADAAVSKWEARKTRSFV